MVGGVGAAIHWKHLILLQGAASLWYTDDEMTVARLHTPQPVPRQFAGKWIAWTPNGLFILGSGNTPAEAAEAARANGPVSAAGWDPSMGVAYEWVPPADERFLGTARS